MTVVWLGSSAGMGGDVVLMALSLSQGDWSQDPPQLVGLESLWEDGVMLPVWRKRARGLSSCPFSNYEQFGLNGFTLGVRKSGTECCGPAPIHSAL